MPCEKCGRTELYFLPKKTVDETQKYIEQDMKEMENWDCNKLAEEMWTTTNYARHEAAKRILLSRGHKEGEKQK
jgi:hypothetical protein